MKDKILKEYLQLLEKSNIKIPLKQGELGLSLDDPQKDYENKIKSGKSSWEKMSKELTTLYIFNKNKHPEVAAKARKLQKSMAVWVAKMRNNDPDFAK